MAATPSPRRRRRRFLQFSLRTLLVFVLLVSIGMSWFAARRQWVKRQWEAVEAVMKPNASSGSGDRLQIQTTIPLWVSKWTRPILGEGFFSNVVAVQCSRSFSDDEASHLKVLTALTVLDVYSPQVTDAGLEHLEGLTNLKRLDLSGTQVTDAGLEHLEGLTNLEYLDLAGTHYVQFVLFGPPTKDVFSGRVVWKRLNQGVPSNGYALHLAVRQVTDRGVGHLAGLKKLRFLDLCSTQVTDAGLEQLKGLTNLNGLNLAHTRVTDAGIAHLQGLKNLEHLVIRHTQVTDEGVKRLHEALPTCEVFHWQ